MPEMNKNSDENKKKWEQILAHIAKIIDSKADFLTWFKDTAIKEYRADSKTLIISVGTDLAYSTLHHKYTEVIKEAANVTDTHTDKIEIVVDTTLLDKPKEEKINVKNIEEPISMKAKEAKKVIKNLTLNPRYKFDNYIVGDNNRVATAIGLAIAKSPGKAHNPLFLYGDVGVGKTHLLQAVGNEIIRKSGKKTAVYCAAESYVNEFVEAIKKNQTQKFKDKYRKVDVLIMDDIQFLAKTEKSQEELFHTFNHLIEENKQVVFSSDRPPRELANITERLRSRFESGMIADITGPNFETRLAILRSKCQEMGVLLSDNILDFIATNVAENVRELEGVLHQIITIYEINGQISIEDIQRHLIRIKHFPETAATQRTVSASTVVNFAAEHFGISPSDITGTSRKKEIVVPRQVVMFIMKENLELPLEAIGKEIGGKNHTTVLHSIRKIEKELQNDQALLGHVNTIKRSLGLI